jgi:hypothetical protein
MNLTATFFPFGITPTFEKCLGFLLINRLECRRKYQRERMRVLRQNPDFKKKGALECKQWREKNRDKMLAYRKRYAEENRDLLRERSKRSYLANYENHVRAVVRWQKANPEKVKKYRQKTTARPEFKIQQSIKKAALYLRDKKIIIKRVSSWQKKQRASSGLYRLITSYRTRLGNVLRGKIQTTWELLGCDRETLRKHLESQFTLGMTWDNYGNGTDKWAVDHKIPIDSFDLSDPDQNKKCWHFSNLQPMWFVDNCRKGNRILKAA